MNLNRNLFISRKNYYLVLLFDRIFKLLWWISIISGLRKTRPGIKNRIVLIGPTHLGDILLSTPAIRFAKEKNPALEIVCIVSSSSITVVENNPYLSGVEVVDLPWFLEKKGSFIEAILSFFRFVKALKGINAEIALNFSSIGYHREHLAMWLAGIPQRVGFSHKGFGYFLTRSPPFRREELIAAQKLRMIGHWLGEDTNGYSLRPDYVVYPASERKAGELITSLDFEPGRMVVGINPGARHNYLWPASHYVELCKMIYEQWKANLLFLGTKSSEGLIEQIRSQLDFATFSLAGETSLEEMAAIVKKIDLLITVDTGTRHIANTVGTKVVVMKHAADPLREFDKYVPSEELIIHKVSCSPCGLQKCKHQKMYCMEDITAEQCFRVVEASMPQLSLI